MGSLKSTNLPFFRCHIFVSFRNNVGINCTYITTTHRSGFLPAPTMMTLNDLECPIHLKVRLVDGTLDVRLLRVSDSTICIGVAREGRGGGGLEGLAPSIWAADALFLCGSWASCYNIHVIRDFNMAWPKIKILGAYSRKVANSCRTCDDRKSHLRRRELSTKQIARATGLDANFATRFVNKSHRACDVNRKRFATSHMRSTFVNRPPGYCNL